VQECQVGGLTCALIGWFAPSSAISQPISQQAADALARLAVWGLILLAGEQVSCSCVGVWMVNGAVFAMCVWCVTIIYEPQNPTEVQFL
jgi:hypothetical protein